jgi:predicted RNase H-like HicB family nuclease
VQPLTLTVVYEPVEDGWVQARIAEIPGVITAGRNRDEAKELVLDALREYLLAAGEGGDSLDSEALTLQVRSA